VSTPVDLPTRAKIIELRQYTLAPGRRDELIELFDTEFVSSQETAGIHVIGQFYDLDDPNRFVWLRGFESMASRAPALHAFYYGPVWARHRDAANATMIDSDNVLLLHPVMLGAAYPRFGQRDAVYAGVGLFCADVVSIPPEAVARDPAAREGLGDALARVGAEVVAIFESEASPNNFPQLPIRADTVLVVVTRFATSVDLDQFIRRTQPGTPYHSDVLRALGATRLTMERRRLRPTAQSQLR
jgi:hypothetical protein